MLSTCFHTLRQQLLSRVWHECVMPILALVHKIWKRRILKGSDFRVLIIFIASSMALFKKLTCFSATLAILQNKLILAAVA